MTTHPEVKAERQSDPELRPSEVGAIPTIKERGAKIKVAHMKIIGIVCWTNFEHLAAVASNQQTVNRAAQANFFHAGENLVDHIWQFGYHHADLGGFQVKGAEGWRGWGVFSRLP